MTDYMQIALKEAKKAMKKGEVPIGAVIVIGDKIIAKGRNSREKTQNALAHAEVNAIKKACRKMKSWRLDNAEIYVTLEPCPMCAGAIANARIRKIIYAAEDTTSQDDLCKQICESNRLNHKVKFEQGDHTDEAKELLKTFFKERRK